MNPALITLTLSGVLLSPLAANDLTEKSITEGITQAQVIAVGTTHSSAFGGGGTTTGFRISELLRGKEILRDQTNIVVHFSHNVQKNVRPYFNGPFIWFLLSEDEGKTFKEITDSERPFVKATPENIAMVKRLLR